MLEKRLQMLYAPAYGYVITGILFVKDISPNRMMIGSMDNHPFLKRRKIDAVIYCNIQYASLELIEAWSKYSASKGVIDEDTTNRLIYTIVSEFNYLRKKLHLPFDEEELITGIPKSYAHLRKHN